MHKLIVVGPPFAGKSTLVRELREKHPSISVKEIDEMLINKNGGQWPTDEHLRNGILMPQLTEELLSSDEEFVFVTTYLNPKYIASLRERGDKVIQLITQPSVLIARNTEHDESRQSEMQRNLEYQQMLRDKKLVDIEIDASRPTSEIAEEIVMIISEGETHDHR